MSEWRRVELYAAFMRMSGSLEVVSPDRLSDRVNRVEEYLQLEGAEAVALSPNSPVLSRGSQPTTIAKSSVTLICPVEERPESNPPLWREKIRQPLAINTTAFSIVGDVYLEMRHTFQDHLERHGGEFIPMTTVSALWMAALGAQTQALQRSFALLNPATILSFSLR